MEICGDGGRKIESLGCIDECGGTGVGLSFLDHLAKNVIRARGRQHLTREEIAIIEESLQEKTVDREVVDDSALEQT